MITQALRLYGKEQVRLDTVDLPPIKPYEILVKIVVDSQCASTVKEIMLGNDHSRTPPDLAVSPVILGHELAGVIEEVGSDYQQKYKPGQRFTIQPPLYFNECHFAVGYSFPYLGGLTHYAIMGREVLETGSFHVFDDSLPFYAAALAEPLSCIVSSHKEIIHVRPGGHTMDFGLKPNGHVAILGGCGPMGLLQLAYCLYGPVQPSSILVTEVDENRLAGGRAVYLGR